MRFSMLLAAALASAATFSFAGRRPVAQWDVVPYQRVGTLFQAGVVAMYDKPIKVEFSVNGTKVAEVDKPTLNGRTRVVEYWFSLDPSKFAPDSSDERILRLGAKVIAEDGTSHVVPETELYWNCDGAAGSTKEVWLDIKDGIDYGDGSEDHPVKSMKRAFLLAGDGGTVYLRHPGEYSIRRIGGGAHMKYWTTIMPAPGLTRKDINLLGGRTGCAKLRLRNVTVVSDVVGGTGYALGGINETSCCWLEDCIVRDKGGRAAGDSYVFGNKLVGYVTGGATTEMGEGPHGKIVRNHVIKSICGDAFTCDDSLAVNCRLDDVDGAGQVDEPVFHRAQGIRGAWIHDVILANIRATKCACTGFTGRGLRDSVFSNVTIETVQSGKVYQSRYAGEMENVWFDRVKLVGQDMAWLTPQSRLGDFAPTDVRVTECSFELSASK